MKYTFGDSPTADLRLKKISSFFNPLAQKFIENHIEKPIKVATDVACGPGYTTEMLSLATKAKKTIGLDTSKTFISSAKKQFPTLKFKIKDVTSENFPMKSDVIYCRFILSHLINIKDVIKHWVHQLKPGGMLFIDELYDIKTRSSLFRKYLKISKELIRSQGANLYIGKEIDALVKSFCTIYNENSIFEVKNHMAAEWFYPNTVSIWKTNKRIQKLTTKPEREEISRKLYNLADNKTDESDICWIMKRLIIKEQ